MARKERVAHEHDEQEWQKRTMSKYAPLEKEDCHKRFQFGKNPMEMTPFEKSCAALEVAEREEISRRYIKGIQGKDGGLFPTTQNKQETISPFNTRGSDQLSEYSSANKSG